MLLEENMVEYVKMYGKSLADTPHLLETLILNGKVDLKSLKSKYLKDLEYSIKNY